MVKIVNKERHYSVTKETVCKKCGATLSYVPLDVKKDRTIDYTADRDYYHYIDCANCSNKVHVKIY